MNGSSMQQSYPFPIPFPMFGGSQQAQGLLDNDAPARVKVAIEFLAQLAIKTLPRAAATEHTIEWAEMPKLTANEIAAQGAACSMLVNYFAGDMKLDSWEAMRQKAAIKGTVPSSKPGTLLRCFACAPDYVDDCKVCANKRTVVVYPST